MADIRWKASGRATNPLTLMTTELNALANNAAALSSVLGGTGVVPNGTDLDLYADIEILVTFGVAPTANNTIDIYIVRSVDGGTNFEDASATGPVLPKNGYVGSGILRAVTTAQRMVIPAVLLPPGDFKVMVVNNNTGQALAATGNTVRAFFYHQQAA